MTRIGRIPADKSRNPKQMPQNQRKSVESAPSAFYFEGRTYFSNTLLVTSYLCVRMFYNISLSQRHSVYDLNFVQWKQVFTNQTIGYKPAPLLSVDYLKRYRNVLRYLFTAKYCQKAARSWEMLPKTPDHLSECLFDNKYQQNTGKEWAVWCSSGLFLSLKGTLTG